MARGCAAEIVAVVSARWPCLCSTHVICGHDASGFDGRLFQLMTIIGFLPTTCALNPGATEQVTQLGQYASKTTPLIAQHGDDMKAQGLRPAQALQRAQPALQREAHELDAREALQDGERAARSQLRGYCVRHPLRDEIRQPAEKRARTAAPASFCIAQIDELTG